MKTRVGLVLLLVTLLACVTSFAQANKTENSETSDTASPQEFYRLDYVLRELDGNKEISKRNYTVTTRSAVGESEHLRTGTKVPVTTGPGMNGRPDFQYMDVGVNVDTQMRVKAGVRSLDVTAELTSIATEDGTKSTPFLPPLMRQARISGSVPIVPGKSLLVFSADEPTSSRRFELTVTATQLK